MAIEHKKYNYYKFSIRQSIPLTEHRIKNEFNNLKKKERERKERNFTKLGLHTKITARLTSSAANKVCNQYNHHQTRQCTTHCYRDDVRRVKRTVFG